MACAVATAVVSAIRAEGLVERSRRVGAVFLQGLRQVAGRRAAVRDVRGRGLMMAMELCRKGDRSMATPVFRRLLEEGFLVGCKPTADILRFYPPLTIGEKEISRLLAHLDGALKPLS
jgi:4-aminobutyrate aminotransferase-like enzyme